MDKSITKISSKRSSRVGRLSLKRRHEDTDLEVCKVKKAKTSLDEHVNQQHQKQREANVKLEAVVKLESKEHEAYFEINPSKESLGFRTLQNENLHCDYYTKFFTRKEADKIVEECENTLQYFEGSLAKVRVFGKWHDIPRKQVSHGDAGLTYTYSGITTPAKPWTLLLERIRDRIEAITKQRFNFVLINRYKDGADYMGEHRDDEADLDPFSSIASLSLGQERDFIFRHKDARGKNAKRKDLSPVTVKLQHGSLLLMNPPTNDFWYHSLPKRANATGVRLNMTFRKILRQKCVKVK